MSKICEYLYELKISNYGSLQKYIANNDIKTIHSLVLHLRDLIDSEYVLEDYTPFTYVPNADISGTGGCQAIPCRISRARKFSNFSALYADRVYINLEYITSEHYEQEDIDEIESNIEMYDWYKESVGKDLLLIIAYFKLIEKGIVYITPARHMMCMDCFQKSIFGSEKRIDIEELKADYTLKAKVILRGFDKVTGSADIGVENISEFFPDHDLFWSIDDRKALKLLAKEKIGSEIKNKRFTQKFISDFIEEEIIGACYTALYCQEQNARLITNKKSDSMFLGMNSSYKNLNYLENQYNSLPEYRIPIVKNLDLENLLRLREEERESFNNYRIALNRAIVEQMSIKNEIDLRKIYDDLIYPELNKLDMKLKQIKKGKLNKFFGTMSIIGIVIVANKFGNFINPSLLAASISFGIATAATSANFILENLSNKKIALQDNDFYFLWKLKGKSRCLKR